MHTTLQIQRDHHPVSSPAGRASPDSVILVEGLVKRFGDLTAVQGVDLAVERGTVFGLLGPNGAGKTTTIRVLTTLLTPDAGHASILGIDLTQDPQTVRESIGLAGQYAAVDENLTGRENLRLVGRLTHLDRSVVRPRADELLERFGLVDAADRPVRTYSGGMRRRLDLAAALVHKPPVLFLDEPTTGLDIHSRNDLWSIIGELVDDGTTVLLTTQYLEEADRLADRIAVIDRGQKVAEGTATELKRSFGNTIIDVAFNDVVDADRARAVLNGTAGVESNPDHRSMQISVANAREVLDVARLLDRAELDPETFIVREPTLDDVFLVLTGHVADETPDGETS
jgi:daunorubicin resistance ABC transporter ATP-binding subunit